VLRHIQVGKRRNPHSALFALASSLAPRTVHAIRVRPVGFNRDNSEAALRNKPLRDRRALGLKLVGAVRSFAEQNEPCVTDKRQQRIVILRAASQRLNRFADDCRLAHGQLFLLRANKQCATQAAIEASYSSVTLKVICSPRCSGQDAV
jgi:hypothetical protein